MTYTKNYNLDLYEPEDLANFCDGFNHNMEKLDSLLYQIQSMVTTANNAISTINTQIASLETRVTNLESKA